MKIISASNNQVVCKNKPQANWLKESLASIAQRLLKECKKQLYTAKESFGYQKRDIVVYHVEEAREGLEETKDQFRTALEHFRSVTSFDGGQLEQKYQQLKSEYQQSQVLAKAVHNRIHAIEDVATALFDEWEGELDQYTSRALRSNSRQQLKTARHYYSRLIKAMKQAETKIYPVLAAFQDQVLFLKHNLNSQAIASLRSEFVSVGINIAGLISAMEKSIHEANAFTNKLLESRP